MFRKSAVIACTSTFLLAGWAEAGPSPAAVCQAGKLKATASYSACRLKADAVAAIKGTPAVYTKCDDKFSDKFPATETKAGPGVCTTEGDAAALQTFLSACEHAADLALDDAGLAPSVCGDGVRGTGEACDGADLDGKSCATFGSSSFTGLTCTTACEFDFSGCAQAALPASRYVDVGDGTITDVWSGLMWEKKTGTFSGFVTCNTVGSCTDPHDVNNSYAWTTAAPAYDGPVRTNFLDLLNDVAGGGASCFAGHCDWRLPTVLEQRVLLQADGWTGTCAATPCVDPDLPGPTGSGGYWTSTTDAGDPTKAWWVRYDFGGGTFTAFKGVNRFARAVRSAL